MAKVIDLTGNKYSRLKVIECLGTRNNRAFFKCRCDCGNFVNVLGASLKYGGTTSCGCYRKELMTKHGSSNNPLYRAYKKMHYRCYDKKFTQYKDYGGRGIKVCDRWHKLENFMEDMKGKPSKFHSLDRINNDGNYEKSNVTWSSKSEQCLNRRKRKKSSSKYRGVYKQNNSWIASVTINGRSKYLGTFKNELHAAIAYNIASWKERQDGRYLNEVVI